MIGDTNAHVIEPAFSRDPEVLVDSDETPSEYCDLNGHVSVLYQACVNFKNTECTVTKCFAQIKARGL